MSDRARAGPAVGEWIASRVAALDGLDSLRLFLLRAAGTVNLWLLLWTSIWLACGLFPFPDNPRAAAAGWTWAGLCTVALVALWYVPWQRVSSLAFLPLIALGFSGVVMVRLLGARPAAFTLFFLWLWFAALAYRRRGTILAVAITVGIQVALALASGQPGDAIEAVTLLLPCYLISCLAVRVAAERFTALWHERARARNTAQRFAALHAFSALLASEHRLDHLLSALVRGLADRFGYRLVSVFLLLDGRLQLQDQVGYTTPITSLALGEGITGQVALTGRPLLVRDGRRNLHFLFAEDHIGSQASVPLLHRGEILGVLNLEGALGELDEDDLHFLEALAGPAAVAIRNANLVRQLDELAHRDALTHLLNRRGILAALEEALVAPAPAGRRRADVALLLIDLNNFKAVNDRYGHPTGDALLCDLAGLLELSVRQASGRGDQVGRLGGDEFLVVLPGADEGTALDVIERLTAILATHPFALLEADDGLPPPSVGYSLGVAVAPRDGDDTAALLAAADRAMYHAKRGSTGAIRFATSGVVPPPRRQIAG